MPSGDESDAEHMSTDMSEDIRDGGHSHPSINRREAEYRICDHLKKIQAERKGELLSMRKMSRGLHKVFKDVR